MQIIRSVIQKHSVPCAKGTSWTVPIFKIKKYVYLYILLAWFESPATGFFLKQKKVFSCGHQQSLAFNCISVWEFVCQDFPCMANLLTCYWQLHWCGNDFKDWKSCIYLHGSILIWVRYSSQLLTKLHFLNLHQIKFVTI